MARVGIGSFAKLQYAVGGAGGTPSWVDIASARDVTVTLEANDNDVTTRASGGFEQTAQGLKRIEVEAEVLATDEAAIDVLRAAWFAGTVLGFRCLDKDNGEGPVFNGTVMRFTRNEPLGEDLTYSLHVKNAGDGFTPTWDAPG